MNHNLTCLKLVTTLLFDASDGEEEEDDDDDDDEGSDDEMGDKMDKKGDGAAEKV